VKNVQNLEEIFRITSLQAGITNVVILYKI